MRNSKPANAYYWAVRPVSARGTLLNTRIEAAITARQALERAFGRGPSNGAFEAKNLGKHIRTVQIDKRRIALLKDNDGWEVLR